MQQSPSDFQESHRLVETLAEQNIYIKVKNKAREDIIDDTLSKSAQSDFKKMMEARDDGTSSAVKRDDQAAKKRLVSYLATMQGDEAAQ